MLGCKSVLLKYIGDWNLWFENIALLKPINSSDPKPTTILLICLKVSVAALKTNLISVTTYILWYYDKRVKQDLQVPLLNFVKFNYTQWKRFNII